MSVEVKNIKKNNFQWVSLQTNHIGLMNNIDPKPVKNETIVEFIKKHIDQENLIKQYKNGDSISINRNATLLLTSNYFSRDFSIFNDKFIYEQIIKFITPKINYSDRVENLGKVIDQNPRGLINWGLNINHEIVEKSNTMPLNNTIKTDVSTFDKNLIDFFSYQENNYLSSQKMTQYYNSCLVSFFEPVIYFQYGGPTSIEAG